MCCNPNNHRGQVPSQGLRNRRGSPKEGEIEYSVMDRQMGNQNRNIEQGEGWKRKKRRKSGTTNSKGYLKIHMEIYYSKSIYIYNISWTRHLMLPNKTPSAPNKVHFVEFLYMEKLIWGLVRRVKPAIILEGALHTTG